MALFGAYNYAALATLKQQALPTLPSTTPLGVDGVDGEGVDDQGNHSLSTTQVGPKKSLLYITQANITYGIHSVVPMLSGLQSSKWWRM